MHTQDLVFIACGAVFALAVLIRDAIRHDRARRARFGRQCVRSMSPGCFRCHGCDSHKCDGSCSVARADSVGGGFSAEGTK